MKMFKVPYSVIMDGEFTTSADSATQALRHARGWLGGQDAVEMHRTLLEGAAGRIRIHSDKVVEQVPEEPTLLLSPQHKRRQRAKYHAEGLTSDGTVPKSPAAMRALAHRQALPTEWEAS